MINRLLPLIAFMTLAVLLFVGVRMNAGKDTSAIPSPLINKPAPVLNLPTLTMPQQSISLPDLKGRAFVLNIWGSWCVSCRLEHPVITELSKSGVLVVGYNYKDSAEDAQRWLNQFGNPYALIIQDENGKAALDWGISGAPETFA
ncbi:MAG: DsbE family thiol:disulfide interchange protein, partial [Polaromonas sp.]|nr:DsbE family thiol:disulfide interchange protein [Polaromonas sp.]